MVKVTEKVNKWHKANKVIEPLKRGISETIVKEYF